MIPNWFESIPAVIELFLLLAAGGSAAWGIWMGVYKPLRRHFNRVNAGMDTLLGYPAVKDPGSGREIQPATPPLAARVYDLEETNKKMAEALEVLASNQRQILQLQEEMDARKAVGEQIVSEWMKWREAHELEAQRREERIAEWEAWRHEQNLLMEALQNAHQPPHNTKQGE